MNRLIRILTQLVAPLATLGIGDSRPYGNSIFDDFIARCKTMNHPRVLELGTKRSIASRSTRRDSWVPHASEYLGTDIEAGVDVNIVADAHRLTETTGEEQFDIIISCSTFEHFKYPHLVAHEIMKALRVGGVVFIQTHQSFPLHAYPYDYFRFSREALAGLFGTQMGFHVRATDYYFPVRLYSPHDPGGKNNPAFLNVRLFGEKIRKTPPTYIYEYDKP
jgi:SAM-dependent methyltransferase